VSLEVRLRGAVEVAANLAPYAPTGFPERPEVLTYDDGQLVEAYRAREYGDKMSKAAGEQLRYFGAWRTAVWRIEAHQEGTLVMLAGAINALELGDRWDLAKVIREFIRQHWRASLPEPVPSSGRWVYGWAQRFSQNRTVLPLWLRTMTKPPVGHGTRSSGRPESGGQRDLNYGTAEEWSDE
jgi:hypothetical protein